MPACKKCIVVHRTKPYKRPPGECKFLDTSLGATLVTTAGVVNTNLVVIPQDTTTSGRNGRKVTLKSIELRGSIVITPAAAGVLGSDIVRMLVVQDKQANGAAFAVTDVLASADWKAYPNLFNEGRFKILSDTLTTMNVEAGVVAATVEAAHGFEIKVKCNIPVEYDSTATTGAIATQRSNSIAVLMIAHTNNLSTVEYTARVKYTDNSP